MGSMDGGGELVRAEANLSAEANFDWQATGANLRGKAWKRTSQVNIWANIVTETDKMQCLLIQHIMTIMMLTDMYADGGDVLWRDQV